MEVQVSDQVLITSNTLQVLWTGAAQSSSRATPRTVKHKAQTHTTTVQSEHKAQTHTTTVQSEQDAPPAADQLLTSCCWTLCRCFFITVVKIWNILYVKR